MRMQLKAAYTCSLRPHTLVAEGLIHEKSMQPPLTYSNKAPVDGFYQHLDVGVGLEVCHAYVSIRQHTSAYVSIRQHTPAYYQHLDVGVGLEVCHAYVSIRQHTSACVYVSIRHHTSSYVSIRQHK
jgi:hypothetical protein